MKLDKGFDPAS